MTATHTAERSQLFHPRPQRPPKRAITTLLPVDQAAGKPGTTIGDYIVSQIDKGVPPIIAAATAGIDQATYMTWLREGQLVIARLNGGSVWETDFTPEQQDMAVFAERAVRAHALRVARLTVKADEIACGGLEKRSTRTKKLKGADDAESLLEVVETVETALPDAAMVQWLLEHGEPSIFGRKATVNINVADMTDTAAVKEVIIERFDQIVATFKARAIEAQAIEVTATDVEATG